MSLAPTLGNTRQHASGERPKAYSIPTGRLSVNLTHLEVASGYQWDHDVFHNAPRHGVKIAGLVAAVSLAAAGFMYFGVVGHNQRAMEMAQTGVRAAFIGLGFVWGARELINLVAGAAGQPTLH